MNSKEQDATILTADECRTISVRLINIFAAAWDAMGPDEGWPAKLSRVTDDRDDETIVKEFAATLTGSTPEKRATAINRLVKRRNHMMKRRWQKRGSRASSAPAVSTMAAKMWLELTWNFPCSGTLEHGDTPPAMQVARVWSAMEIVRVSATLARSCTQRVMSKKVPDVRRKRRRYPSSSASPGKLLRADCV
jgi:hypothetical protein